MEDQTRSLSEVAGLMGVSERTVRRWIKGGKLKAYKPGRDYRIPEAGLRAFIEESEISPKDQAPLQLELEEPRGADEERRHLSALLDPPTRELRRISENYGPHLRLLPPTPSPEEIRRFSWIAEFLQACTLIDHMVRHPHFSAVVGPWLSRMNDETIPVDIRQKLRDFEAAQTELFDEVEPLAEAWIASQRERLPDEWLAKWTAEFRHSPEELGKPPQPERGAALPNEEQRTHRYLRVMQLFASEMDRQWTAIVERNEFTKEDFEKGAETFRDFDDAFAEGIGTDLLGALREGEITLSVAERESFDNAKASLDAWQRTMWSAHDALKIRGISNVAPLSKVRGKRPRDEQSASVQNARELAAEARNQSSA